MTLLFTCATDRLTLTWFGPATSRAGMPRIEVVRPGARVSLDAPEEPLVLEEETTYRLLLQAQPGHRVALRHRDPVVQAALHASVDEQVVTGTFNVGAQMGASRFVLLADGRPEVALTVEVIPTKVSSADAAHLYAEVEAMAAGLAWRYLRETTVPAQPMGWLEPPPATWLALVQQVLSVLEEALGRIEQQPARDVVRPATLVAAARVRRPDAAVRRAVTLRRGHGPWQATTPPIRATVLARPATWTLDTPEHRWLRAQVQRAAQRTDDLQHAEARLPMSARRLQTLEDLAAVAQHLRALGRRSVLASATEGAPEVPTLRLRRQPGYADAYAACRLLDQALERGHGAYEASLIDLAHLYEVWCYLTVARTVAEVLGVEGPRRLPLTALGLQRHLRVGTVHALRFEGRDGLRVRLAYNPRFGAPGLLVQRPDLLLRVAPPEGPVRHYVLDAKYRRDDSPATRRRYGTPGPPEDALGDLHRYRDAIVEAPPIQAAHPDTPTAPRRVVREAVALFPWREEEAGAFRRSRLWRSIEDLGIGALPLLPGQIRYLRQWLERVLGLP